jgi:uncharacterized protein
MKRGNDIIKAVADLIKLQFQGETTGHDWYHIERVWKNAKLIAKNETADLFIVELGALLHDIADHKFVEDAENEAELRCRDLLKEFEIEESDIQKVVHIVQNCSFKGGVGGNRMKSIEGLIVQDADRLDALGAIGITRAFAYGGQKGNMIYDPDLKPQTFESEEEYRASKSHTINHFYEKLLVLKGLMNTKSAKQLAEQRHAYMESFLEQFYKEWDGEV